MFLIQIKTMRFLDTTSNACFARGCIYDSVTQSNYPACYVPIQKGGYRSSAPENILNMITQYTLTRVSKKPERRAPAQLNRDYRRPPSNLKEIVTTDSNEFSIYGHDIDRLNVQVSVSVNDMIRLTIRDAEKDRYEVPVPIHWQPAAQSTKTKAKIQFEMTRTSNGQAGFRVRRTDTRSIIFDTTDFAHGLIYDNQFIQFITTVPSTNVYGKLIIESYLLYRV
jgi:hypothetical protein